MSDKQNLDGLKTEDPKKVKQKKEKTVARQRLLHGVYSGVAILLVIVIAIGINIFVSDKNWSVDLSTQKFYTLSKQTKKICKSLDQDIKITVISKESNFTSVYKSIVKEYKKLNSKIKIEYKDPELYPNVAKDYLPTGTTAASSQSILVTSGEKGKYIDSSDFLSTSTDNLTGQSEQNVALEQKLTQAIDYCVSDNTKVVYQLSGQGEIELTGQIGTKISDDNYELKTLDLLSEKEVPEDCSVLVISAPTKDLQEDVVEKIKKYKDNGGKVYAMVDVSTEDLTNYYKFLADNGVEVQKGVIVETDADHYYQQTPIYLLPTVNSSKITEDIAKAGYAIIAPLAKGLKISDTTKATSLLDTSDGAYSKVNTQSTTVEKEKGDIDGPFSIAAFTGSEEDPSMVVLSCTSMLTDQVDQYSNYANSDFVVNGINALSNQESKISVRAKSLKENTAVYTTAQQKIIMVLTIFLIPIFIIMIGIVVIIVRKSKSKSQI